MTPNEQKQRETNLSHIIHLKEAMRAGLEKWDEELKEKNEMVRQVWTEGQRETLDGWLQDFNTVLHFAENAPAYIPSVKPQWQMAV